MLTGVPKIQILNSAEKKAFHKRRHQNKIETVRHVTGNDKDYLRLIPRVVW